MPRGTHPGKPRFPSAHSRPSSTSGADGRSLPGAYVDLDLQIQICADLNRHLDSLAALNEYLQVLHATVTRLRRHSGKADPGLDAAIHDAILAQYRSVTTHLSR